MTHGSRLRDASVLVVEELVDSYGLDGGCVLVRLSEVVE